MERTSNVQTTATTEAQQDSAPAQANAQTRFVSHGAVPAVQTGQRDQGPSASDQAFEANKGNQALKRHDMQWSDDIGQNAVKDAFWKARWNGEIDLLPAARHEIERRADAAPEDAGLHGNGHVWGQHLAELLWDVKKLHDNDKHPGERSYVDVHKFRSMLAAFPTKQLLWPDEKALISAGFETLVTQGAATWNKPVGLAERTGGGEGELAPTSEAATAAAKPETAETKEAKREGGERVELLLKVLNWASHVPQLAPHAELIHATIELVQKANRHEGTAAEYAQNISEIGSALMEELGLLMHLCAEGGEAAELVLGPVADVFGMPAAAIAAGDDISQLVRAKHLNGKPVSQQDRYRAAFDLVTQLKTFGKGVGVLAELSPKLSAALLPVGEAVGWANPVTIGVTVSYYELEFCVNHVYTPAKQYLGRYLTDKRTGGDPEAIIKRIEAMPVNQATFEDIAPFFSGSTGESLAYLYGNANVFGQGERGWGWLGEGEHAQVGTWTRFWDDSIRGGKLAQFAMPDVAKQHDKYWGNLAIIAKELAVQFIHQQIASGRVDKR